MLVFAQELEKGMSIRIDGCPFVVADFRLIKYGKGASFIQAELRSALSGALRQLKLRPMERLERIDLDIKQMRYLRDDGDNRIFSDVMSYEEVAIPNDFLFENAQLHEEDEVWRVLYIDGELYAVTPSVSALI